MLSTKELYNRYKYEIEITKRRIVDHISILSIPEIIDLQLTLEPRNNSEIAIKEDFMSFVAQRKLEGYNAYDAKKMAEICVNKAIDNVKEIWSKKIKKYQKEQMKINKK